MWTVNLELPYGLKQEITAQDIGEVERMRTLFRMFAEFYGYTRPAGFPELIRLNGYIEDRFTQSVFIAEYGTNSFNQNFEELSSNTSEPDNSKLLHGRRAIQ